MTHAQPQATFKAAVTDRLASFVATKLENDKTLCAYAFVAAKTAKPHDEIIVHSTIENINKK